MLDNRTIGVLIITVFVAMFASLAIGINMGMSKAQATIVSECKNGGIYTDRQLILRCQPMLFKNEPST